MVAASVASVELRDTPPFNPSYDFRVSPSSTSIRTRSIRRRVASKTVMRTLRHSNSSPTTGMWPNSLNTKPPMVSKSASSGSSRPSCSLTVSTWHAAQRLAHALAQQTDRLDLVGVVFIDDLAHDLLQHVFHGHHAGDAAVFVQHDGHVVPPALKVLQQGVDGLGLGHEHRLTQQRGPRLHAILRRLGQLGQQVLDVENAHDVVAILAEDRHPRVARLDDLFEGLVPGDVGRNGEHVGPRRHDPRDVDVAEFDHAFDHFAGVFFEQSLAVAFGDDGADLLVERIFVGFLGRSAGEAMEDGIDEAGGQPQRRQA